MELCGKLVAVWFVIPVQVLQGGQERHSGVTEDWSNRVSKKIDQSKEVQDCEQDDWHEVELPTTKIGTTAVEFTWGKTMTREMDLSRGNNLAWLAQSSRYSAR